MSYDIFFVRRDPGQTFEDALDHVEDSFEGGDPGPLSEDELEQWDQLLPRALTILGPQVEVSEDSAETRELTDPDTGIGLTFIEGEFEIHVPENRAGRDEIALMSTVYELARAVEQATGLEGYDPQLGEPVSDVGRAVPVGRGPASRTVGDGDDEDERSTTRPLPRQGGQDRPPARPVARRWWEFWKA